MSPEKQRMAIAEALGAVWTDEGVLTFHHHIRRHQLGPMRTELSDGRVLAPEILNYPECLNAMHEAERVLNAGQINTYLGNLYKNTKAAEVGYDPWQVIAARVAVHSTAAQRAEAFLRTIGKWRTNHE